MDAYPRRQSWELAWGASSLVNGMIYGNTKLYDKLSTKRYVLLSTIVLFPLRSSMGEASFFFTWRNAPRSGEFCLWYKERAQEISPYRQIWYFSFFFLSSLNSPLSASTSHLLLWKEENYFYRIWFIQQETHTYIINFIFRPNK